MASRKVKCCVRNCPAEQMEGLTYFSLPVDLERRIIWLQAVGRPDMTAIDNLKPKNHVVCSIHFEDHQVSILKQTLPDAEPTRNIPKEFKGVFKTISSVQTQTDFSSDSDGDSGDDSDCSDDTEVKGVSKSVTSIKTQTDFSDDSDDDSDYSNDIDDTDDTRDTDESGKGKKRKCDDNDKTESKRLKTDTTNDVDFIEDESAKVKPNINYAVWNNFFEWKDRTTNRRKGRKFNEDFNMFALNLHTINSRAYKLLMGTLQLPSEKELKMVDLKIGPRLDDRMVSLLSQKFKLLSKEGRLCTLGLQVVPLKNHLYYDAVNDDIIGVHNVNGGRTNEAASYALIAMVRGIRVQWCQPLTFALVSAKTDPDIVDDFLSNLFGKLKKMSLQVLGIVMPDDEWLYKYCKVNNFMARNQPFITVHDVRLHVVFDVPHVLNTLRDDFMTCDFVHEGNTVSWEYIKQVYHINKEKGGKLLPKLTDQHLQPDKTEKTLKYPCQVFSKSVAAAISFYVDQGIILEQAKPTAIFLNTVNNVLDTLNLNKTTRVLRDNSRKPETLLKIRARTQFKAAEELCVLIKNLKAVKNGEDVTKDMKSFQYLQIALKGIMNLSQTLKDENNIGLRYTRRLYLESMQHFIELIKEDANSKRPNPIQFTQAFSKLFVEYLIDLMPPPTSVGNMAEFLQMADNIKALQTSDTKERIILNNTDYRIELPDEKALVYVASYLLYKMSKAHKCRELNDYLIGLVDLNETKINVHFEDLNKDAAFYNNLKCPTDGFVEYIENLDECFLDKFDHFHRMYPAVTLYGALKYVPQWEERCSCFPTEYLLKLFVRMRIYQTVIYNTKCLKERLVAHATYKLKVKKL